MQLLPELQVPRSATHSRWRLLLAGCVLAASACGGSTSSRPTDAGTAEAALPESSTPGSNPDDDASTAPDGPADSGVPTADALGPRDAAIPPAQCPPVKAEGGALPSPPAPVCSPLAPTSSTIATFAGASPAAFAPWGTAPLVGGTYVYPTCSPTPPEPNSPLFADYSGDDWHITGSVGAFSGFGLWWVVENGSAGGYRTYAGGLIDASAYAGIQFDVLGNPGPLGVLVLVLQSANQQSLSVDLSRPNCGTCDADAGVCNVASTTNVFGLTSMPQRFRVRWSDLTNTIGPAFDPTRITSIFWVFPWTQGATPYAVDVTLANLQFIAPSSADASGD